MRWALSLLAAAGLVAVLVIGLTQAGDNEAPPEEKPQSFDLKRARDHLQGSPVALAALHDQSNRLLGGGTAAFEKRLKALRGHPVVVNKWASWCGPCRAELPILQQVATDRGREIAFVGVNAKDKRPAALRFTERFPTPYPSYEDPDEQIARALKVPANFPATVFVDAKGKTVFTHQGGYATSRDLQDDLEKYFG